MNKLLYAFVPLIALLLIGCSDPIHYSNRHDIVSVYYHERNDFSVGIMNGNKMDIVRLPPAAHVDVWMDISPENNMWYECDFTHDRFYGEVTGGCSIHIHDVDDINTAGWNHGKFGHGTTTRIDQ